MSAEFASLSVIIRAASPLIKDIYNGAKGEVKKCLEKWGASSFPSNLSDSLEYLDSVRTIWSPEKNVSLSGFYYPSKFDINGCATEVCRVTDLGKGSVVVQGIVGQGKSVFLRYLAIQEILSSDRPRMPVFLELRRLSKSFGLLDGLKAVLSSYDLSATDEVFKYLAESGKIVILLDGFDELDSEVVKDTAIVIEGLVRAYPGLQVVATSRPRNEIQKMSCFRVMDILPLESSDYAGFLGKLGVDVVKAHSIVEAIESSPSKVSELISTPLMLTLVVFVYQSENHIPAELPEFFERLFYTVFTRHDKLKPIFDRQHYTKLSERKLQSLFEAFCFMSMQLGNGRSLSSAQFSKAFDLAQEYTDGSDCYEVDFRNDITKVSCLMLEEGFGDVTFLHKSIAEYHASAFVKNSDDVFAKRFYEHAAKNWSMWEAALSFLKVIDSYRFAKYFAVEQLIGAIALARLLDSCVDAVSFVRSLPESMGGLSANYEQTFDPVYFSYESVGAWTAPDNYYDEDLVDVITDVIAEIVPDSLSVHEISELRNSGVRVLGVDEDLIEIGLIDIFKVWGFERVKESVAQHLADLIVRLDQAKVLAEKLDKRVSIFDKRL
ncbi:NACHT domain-containing protein [Pseudomonas sp. GCEP-101]|uniref:NACHT domain-containing protein n=1 Tax=Pseudomonas sp. GCEP-101 TaxID=2974552 RepID=UPI00223A9468|nr:NACHT domain-containing protein [Pseudomonas sp. GCEP-101]